MRPLQKFAKVLIVLGLALACTLIAFWALKGAHWGWTRTIIEVPRVDPVTELPYTESMPGLVPGVEFLLLASVIAAIFLGAAGALFLVDSKRQKKSTPPSP